MNITIALIFLGEDVILAALSGYLFYSGYPVAGGWIAGACALNVCGTTFKMREVKP